MVLSEAVSCTLCQIRQKTQLMICFSFLCLQLDPAGLLDSLRGFGHNIEQLLFNDNALRWLDRRHGHGHPRCIPSLADPVLKVNSSCQSTIAVQRQEMFQITPSPPSFWVGFWNSPAWRAPSSVSGLERICKTVVKNPFWPSIYRRARVTQCQEEVL